MPPRLSLIDRSARCTRGLSRLRKHQLGLIPRGRPPRRRLCAERGCARRPLHAGDRAERGGHRSARKSAHAARSGALRPRNAPGRYAPERPRARGVMRVAVQDLQMFVGMQKRGLHVQLVTAGCEPRLRARMAAEAAKVTELLRSAIELQRRAGVGKLCRNPELVPAPALTRSPPRGRTRSLPRGRRAPRAIAGRSRRRGRAPDLVAQRRLGDVSVELAAGAEPRVERALRALAAVRRARRSPGSPRARALRRLRSRGASSISRIACGSRAALVFDRAAAERPRAGRRSIAIVAQREAGGGGFCAASRVR